MGLCAGCHGGCCRAFAVPISGADILRLEEGVGVQFWQFVCRWADPAGRIAGSIAPHFRFADEPDTPFAICLLQTASTQFPQATKCLFLEEFPATAESPRGTARCAVYEHRPSACRAFPLRLDAASMLGVIYDVLANGRAGNDPAYQLCPRPWTPEDVDPVQSVQDLVISRYEMLFFHTVARIWNQRCGPWELFPEFLREVYRNRVQSAEPVQAAALPRAA